MSTLTNMRELFAHTSTLLPPRGGHVEILEIRPIRPNQDIILPGVAVRGHGIKFQAKGRQTYRCRNGFAQSDGITQYSGSFHRRCKSFQDHQPLPLDVAMNDTLSGNSIPNFSDLFYPFEGIHNHPRGFHDGYNFKGPKKSFNFQKTAKPNHYHRPSAKTVKRQIDEANFVANLRQKTRTLSTSLPRKYAFGRTIYDESGTFQKQHKPDFATSGYSSGLPNVKYQNYIYVSDDEENQNNTYGDIVPHDRKTRFRSRHRSRIRNDYGSSPNKRRYRSNEDGPRYLSMESLNQAYEHLYNKHLKEIMKLESHPNDHLLFNGNNNNTINAFDGSSEDDEDISTIGEELVNKSLSEVTEDLVRNLNEKLNLRGESQAKQKLEKKVTFEKED